MYEIKKNNAIKNETFFQPSGTLSVLQVPSIGRWEQSALIFTNKTVMQNVKKFSSD